MTPPSPQKPIPAIESALLGAIRQARQHQPMRLVTVVVPNLVSGLQWRRRIARASGALFNVRWIDVNQFAQETITQAGLSIKPVTQVSQLAAAWSALQTSPPEFQIFRDTPEMPHQMVRAFDTLDGLDDDEKPTLQPAVQAMFDAYCQLLDGKDRHNQILKKAADLLQAGTFPHDDAFIFLPSGSLSASQTRLAQALGNRVTTIATDFDQLPPTQATSLHDERDEVDWVIAQIQNAALIESIPVHQIAVILPNRNPYAKLFATSAAAAGLVWNGLGIQSLAESIPGQLLTPDTDADHPTWADAIAACTERVESHDTALETHIQLIKDQLDSWKQLEDLIQTAPKSLISVLRQALLTKPIPCERGFGDGVFVGTSRHLEGLSFERVYVLGFTDSAYPAKSRAIPMLPVGIGVPSVPDQKRYLTGNLSRSNSVELSYSRSDRRSEREAFPSPWLEELTGAKPRNIASPLELLSITGPRTDAAKALAIGLTQGLAPTKAQAAISSWLATDLAPEASVGGNLLPPEGLSPSQIETFLNCPRSWYFKYVIRIPEPMTRPTFGLSSAETGTAIHQTLAQLFQLHQTDLKDPAFKWSQTHFDDVHRQLTAKTIDILGRELLQIERDDIDRWARRLQNVLDQDSNYRSETGAVPSLLEKRLAGNIAGIPFSGSADRIDLLPGGALSVIDYKTGKNKTGAPSNVTTKKLAASPTLGATTLQGLIYAALAKQTLGDHNAYHAGYWFLAREPKEMQVTQALDENSASQLEETVTVAADMMRQGLVPMTPTDDGQAGLCGYCSYCQICPQTRASIASLQQKHATGAYRKLLDLKAGAAPQDGNEND